MRVLLIGLLGTLCTLETARADPPKRFEERAFLSLVERYAKAEDAAERTAILTELEGWPAIDDRRVAGVAKRAHARLLKLGARSVRIGQATPAKYRTAHPEHEGTYYLQAPKSRKPLPVLFALHGGTQGLPGDNPEEIEKANLPPAEKNKILTKVYGKPALKKWMRGWRGAAKYIVVGPNQPGKFGEYYKAWDATGGALFVQEILKEIQRERPVDLDRVYIAGMSNGDYGVWNMGSFYPDVFAAFAGGAGRPTKVCVPNLFNQRFNHYIGEKERPLVPFMKRMEGRFEQMTVFFGGGFTRKLDSHPEIGHDLPPGGTAPMLDWITRYTREPYRKRVLWLPQQGARYGGTHSKKHVPRTSLFWLAAASHLVMGTLGEDNAIDVSWPDMRPISPHLRARPEDVTYRATVLLHRSMVDFGEPVRITSGEELLFEGTVRHSPAVLLRTLAEREDLSMYFTAEVPVELTE